MVVCCCYVRILSTGHDIDDNGAIELVKALKTNKALASLNLRGWQQDYVQYERIQCRKTIVSIVFVGNTIGDKGAVELGQLLMTNTTVTSLDLSRVFFVVVVVGNNEVRANVGS